VPLVPYLLPSHQLPHVGEELPLDDGYIEPPKPREEVRQESYPLPKDFQWCAIDLNDPNQLKEVYDLLSANYVEDDDATFRFQYTAEFLEWWVGFAEQFFPAI
jgi:glycylpeptide N-tetradecanoyltransferase